MPQILNGITGALWGMISNTVARPLRVDSSTHTLQTIEYEHHEIHSGSSFTCNYENTTTNIGEMTVIAFNTPNTTKWIHFVADISSTGACYVLLCENTSIDVGEGTEITIYNRNRNSTNTSTVSSIEATPSAGEATSYNEVQAAGANITTTTTLERNYLGAGDKKTLGGSTRATQEWVLDQNQQYAVIVVAQTNDDAVTTITLDWYEHTDKD